MDRDSVEHFILQEEEVDLLVVLFFVSHIMGYSLGTVSLPLQQPVQPDQNPVLGDIIAGWLLPELQC